MIALRKSIFTLRNSKFRNHVLFLSTNTKDSCQYVINLTDRCLISLEGEDSRNFMQGKIIYFIECFSN